MEKSELIPTQKIVFLGMELDAEKGMIRPAQHRIDNVQKMIQSFLKQKQATLRQVMRLVGMLTSMRGLVPRAALQSRPIQRLVLDAQLKMRLSKDGIKYEKPVLFTPAFLESLPWWGNLKNLTAGIPMDKAKPTVTLVTNASMTGWGGHCMDGIAHGQWNEKQRKFHINRLEMLAVQFSLQSFKKAVKNRAVLIRSDNQTVVAYLNKEGGTKSQSLNDHAVAVLKWCAQNKVELMCKHIPGVQNGVADSLSRGKPYDDTEWELSQTAVNLVFDMWGEPQVDLFATPENKKRPVFVTRYPDKQSLTWDAFQMEWGGMFSYAFPPFPLIHRTLQKLEQSENSHMILVAPNWPSQTWFPLLLSLLTDHPRSLPQEITLTQPGGYTPTNPELYQLHVWKLSSNLELRKGFQAKCRKQRRPGLGIPQMDCINTAGKNFAGPIERYKAPAWSLSVVLEVLRQYEPKELASLQDWTKKTVFLLALASGRRVSEIHALSFEDNFTVFYPDKAILMTSVKFRGKNQKLHETATPIVIPALSNISNEKQDRILCPVRALAYYKKRTSGVRRGQRSMFVCYQKGKQSSAASKFTLARWVKETIYHAYSDKYLSTEAGKVTAKMHDLRGIGNTLAFASGASLAQVLAAGSWKTSNTFLSYYLKDLAAESQGLHSLGYLVTGQVVTKQ
ncbi:uncharacterized protein LOC102805810 [Saccoglossus kowalevskii]|uniref:Uncharacterized protein LOC102805810 n=1 Tax=Saccoglossus kowalevskii TaxID=10224 RepID=A0ABM0MKA1_SACKO|nr:PREDICTED: uncharacterized protein LOC102805810 [Saccoglossus kowalevskii]